MIIKSYACTRTWTMRASQALFLTCCTLTFMLISVTVLKPPQPSGPSKIGGGRNTSITMGQRPFNFRGSQSKFSSSQRLVKAGILKDPTAMSTRSAAAAKQVKKNSSHRVTVHAVLVSLHVRWRATERCPVLDRLRLTSGPQMMTNPHGIRVRQKPFCSYC